MIEYAQNYKALEQQIWTSFEQGDVKEALAVAKVLLHILQLEHHGDHLDIVAVLDDLAWLHRWKGDGEEALIMAAQGVEMLQRLYPTLGDHLCKIPRLTVRTCENS